jgi:hypothetical protein
MSAMRKCCNAIWIHFFNAIIFGLCAVTVAIGLFIQSRRIPPVPLSRHFFVALPFFCMLGILSLYIGIRNLRKKKKGLESSSNALPGGIIKGDK